LAHHTKIIEILNISKIESWWNFPFAHLYKFDIQTLSISYEINSAGVGCMLHHQAKSSSVDLVNYHIFSELVFKRLPLTCSLVN
jgi:hypothetical protein